MADERDVVYVKPVDTGTPNPPGSTPIDSGQPERAGIDVAMNATRPGENTTAEMLLDETPEQYAQRRIEERRHLKARLATVLERGVVHDRLKVDLPPGVHGEWVRNDPLEIHRLKQLGFEIDDTYAANRALHSLGDSKAIVGDVLFMTCTQEVKDIIDEIRQEEFFRVHGKPGDNSGRALEERTFEENARREMAGSHISPTIESKTRQVSAAEIAAAVKAADQQIQPASSKNPPPK